MPNHKDGPARFLVAACDGSPTARNASTVAIQIARSKQLQIRGLYVIEATLVLDPYTNYEAELGPIERPASRTELITRFRTYGEAALLCLKSQCQAAKVPATATIEFGNVPTIVRQEAAQAALLTLGRRGRGHPTDLGHLGRHFRTIAHHTHQPLLVGGDEARPIQRMLLAYNESERAQHALTWAACLQQALAAHVLALVVEDAAEAGWVEKMKNRLAQSNLAPDDFLSRSGQPAAEIVATATDNQIDLIVMGGYRHRAPLEWLVGSTVDRVLRQTALPVLIA